jgi:hypothetical protein
MQADYNMRGSLLERSYLHLALENVGRVALIHQGLYGGKPASHDFRK